MVDLSSPTRDWTSIPCIGSQILNHSTTREAPVVLILNVLVYSPFCFEFSFWFFQLKSPSSPGSLSEFLFLITKWYMVRIMSAYWLLALAPVQDSPLGTHSTLLLVVFFKNLVFSTDFEAQVHPCMRPSSCHPSISSLEPLAFLPVYAIAKTLIPSLPQYQSLKHRGNEQQKEMKGSFNICHGKNWSPHNVFNHLPLEGFHIKSQRPLFLPPNRSSICWSSVNSQIFLYLLVSVWIKLKTQGQVTWLCFFLYRGGKWDTFLRLEPGSGNQLFKMVFEMLFRLSERETFSPLGNREIGSWGWKLRIRERTAGLH